MTPVSRSAVPVESKTMTSTWAMEKKTNGKLRGRLNRNGGTVAYMRPHINFTQELLASSARVRDNIGVFSIKIIGRSQRTSWDNQIVRPILSVGSSVRFLKDSFDRIVLSRSDY